MQIGTRLKKLRLNKHISVYKLSKLSDVSENYIHAVEKNTSQPSIAIVEQLLAALGVSLSEFFNDSENILYPSDDEYQLIQNYRSLSQNEQQAIFNLIKLFAMK